MVWAAQMLRLGGHTDMSDATEPSVESLPEPALIEALTADISTAEKVTVLARLRRRLKKNRASLHEHVRKFNEICNEAGRAFPAEGLVQLAERVHESEKGAAERLDPWIQALQQALATPSREGRQHIAELIEISAAWLEVYRVTRTRLLKLAAERPISGGAVLRARPVEGDIDHETLTREIVARFPKILAALAK
jgi:hypothetical protein